MCLCWPICRRFWKNRCALAMPLNNRSDSLLPPFPEELQEIHRDKLLCGFVHLLLCRRLLLFHASQAEGSEKSITAPVFSPSSLPKSPSVEKIMIMAREKRHKNMFKGKRGVNFSSYTPKSLQEFFACIVSGWTHVIALKLRRANNKRIGCSWTDTMDWTSPKDSH